MFYFHCIVINSGLITWLSNGSSTQLGARYEHCKRLESSDLKNDDGVITDVKYPTYRQQSWREFR